VKILKDLFKYVKSAALVGKGTNVRYAELPGEEHHYRSRDTVLQAAWKMINWLSRNLKHTEAGTFSASGISSLFRCSRAETIKRQSGNTATEKICINTIILLI
jgi:hypothetical protein